MKTQPRQTALIGILTLALAGCPTLDAAALKVRTECQSTAALTVMSPYVYADNGSTLVSGQLRAKRMLGHSITKARLHVIVLDGKGKVLNETVANVTGLPIRHNRFGGPESKRYAVRLPLIPPRDGTVRIILDDSPAKPGDSAQPPSHTRT
jgi:hypothetical protein